MIKPFKQQFVQAFTKQSRALTAYGMSGTKIPTLLLWQSEKKYANNNSQEISWEIKIAILRKKPILTGIFGESLVTNDFVQSSKS